MMQVEIQREERGPAYRGPGPQVMELRRAVPEEADCLQNELDAGGPEARRPRQKPEMGPIG